MSFTRAAFLMSLTAGAICGPASAAGLSVGIDMASPVRLARPAASVVVGNPAIADVQVQTPTLIFLQGRNYGTTNLIALDNDGKPILSVPVTVTSGGRFNVTVERGIGGRITYACSGRCEAEPLPGDASDQFKTIKDMENAKSSQADTAATSKGN